ncbi:MAG: site-specific DNA-methyltransferase [Rhodothermaceae bacterium]|nr:site-specific DNA-methyltransferase [Rhodothermaceae bacterium]
MASNLKVTPVKGRPMLHWVGKRPLDVIQPYPAQLCESFGVENPPTEPLYSRFIKGKANLLFQGDNREVLSSLLIAGFRGKIDLIYIDPPFDSGADYVRNVRLRGGSTKLKGEGQTLLEQVQYEDIWANDNYLQFMYERLILMRELLSGKGSIYLHCDWHKNHHLRFLLDEVFGEGNFRNQVIWRYRRWPSPGKNFQKMHDIILRYSKSKDVIWNQLLESKSESTLKAFGDTKLTTEITERNTVKKIRTSESSSGTAMSDVWEISHVQGSASRERENAGNFPTQKPETLLDRIIQASSDKGSIVLDCFCGSGTTAVVADRLGRRWIMADINKGAVQRTIRRLMSVKCENGSDPTKGNGHGFVHYRVNNYDATKRNELKKIIVSKYGIQIDRKDLFFDGLLDGQLVKIIDLDKPLTCLDIQIIRDEIEKYRRDETRDIVAFCNGSEMDVYDKLAEQKTPINKIIVRDIQRDGIVTNRPAEAEIKIVKKGNKVTVEILDYFSPTILARMDVNRTIFDEQIDDFRVQIDCVLIDTDYNGKDFRIVESDLPKKRKDLISAKYELVLPRVGAKVAVKIVDMLGEEIVEIR